jgi:hypothetical protein
VRTDLLCASVGPGTPLEAWKTALRVLTKTALSLALQRQVMRIVLGFLSGVVGMLAGWFGLAFRVIALAGPDRAGVAMGVFFNIGPLGAFIGFGVGVWLFVKFGLVAQGAAFATTPSSEPASASSLAVRVAPATARISRPFAVIVLAIVGGLAWWTCYEFIRSPYLTHGYTTLALQFRLAASAREGDAGRRIWMRQGGADIWATVR